MHELFPRVTWRHWSSRCQTRCQYTVALDMHCAVERPFDIDRPAMRHLCMSVMHVVLVALTSDPPPIIWFCASILSSSSSVLAVSSRSRRTLSALEALRDALYKYSTTTYCTDQVFVTNMGDPECANMRGGIGGVLVTLTATPGISILVVHRCQQDQGCIMRLTFEYHYRPRYLIQQLLFVDSLSEDLHGTLATGVRL